MRSITLPSEPLQELLLSSSERAINVSRASGARRSCSRKFASCYISEDKHLKISALIKLYQFAGEALHVSAAAMLNNLCGSVKYKSCRNQVASFAIHDGFMKPRPAGNVSGKDRIDKEC